MKPYGQEILLYVTPKGKKKSGIITSNDKGIARMKRMTFDCYQIDFLIINVHLLVMNE